MVPTLILDIGLMTILVVVAFAIVRLRSLFAIVMLQGVYSLVCAAWFVSLDAVDVAFTEAAVGAGVSTVLMLAAMLLVDRKSKPVPVSKQIAPLLIVIVAGLAMFMSIPDMPAYGDGNSPANSYVGADYLESAGPDTHIPNVVTVVLASYRGYDTFGEVVVIFAAGLGVLLLLGLNGNAGGWKAQPNGQRISAPSAPFAHRDRPRTPVQDTAARATAVRREVEAASDVQPESFTAPQPEPMPDPVPDPMPEPITEYIPQPVVNKPAVSAPVVKKNAAAKKAPAKKKSPPKKPVPKKPAAKKPAVKEVTTKKTTTKKLAAKAPAKRGPGRPRKTAAAPVKKAGPKKTAAKKTVAKKTAAKKPAAKRGPGRPRKTAVKKPPTKKSPTKKPVAKKSTVKKGTRS